ncbi:hypothetical protein CHCC20375_1223 [Bacillus licheniformis]|nr:hypothetical protein CHCC20375_1223 [Bacillus licheniformis]
MLNGVDMVNRKKMMSDEVLWEMSQSAGIKNEVEVFTDLVKYL